MAKKKKKIVIIGGGSASAWLLKGMVEYRSICDLSVVGSIADNGGSNGRLQEELGVTGLGALRKCLLALSEEDEKIKNAFGYRFEKGELEGHVAGNIMMAALDMTSGSAESALDICHKMLKVNGKVIPSSFDKVTLFAELENGQIIEGETNIDIPKHDSNLKIRKIFLKPVPRVNPAAVKEIIGADFIIIGPGDLYTTILPNFLVPGIGEAAARSRAKKIFVVNSFNKAGETNDFSVLNFSEEVEKYMGAPLDHVVYNNGKTSADKVEECKAQYPNILEMVRVNEGLDSKKFLGGNILGDKGEPLLNSQKLVKEIMAVIA